MAIAYVFFGKPINADTSTGLIGVCKTLVSERDAGGIRLWDTIHLTIASGGGDIIAAFAAFNELRALQIDLICHNVGAVDSSAIMLMMAGSKRLAARASAFFFHQVSWTFPTQGSLTATTINDATKWLGTYETMMAETVESRTSIPMADVLRMMREGLSIRSDEALRLGIVHAIEDHSVPWDARVTWV